MSPSAPLAVHGWDDQERVAVQARRALLVPLRPPELGRLSDDLSVGALPPDVLRPGTAADGRPRRSLHRPGQRRRHTRRHSLRVRVRRPVAARHPRKRSVFFLSAPSSSFFFSILLLLFFLSRSWKALQYLPWTFRFFLLILWSPP